MTAMPHLAEVAWDHADRMQSADLGGGGTVWFLYDSAGNRVRKIRVNQTGASTYERVYVGGYEVYRERVGAELRLERQTLHVSDDASRICLVETKTVDDADVATPANVSRYQYGNHLGSVGMELDETGQLISYEEFHPYGTTAYRAANSAVDVSPSRYRYTGKERDEETGLGHHGARYYASWLARWTAADPIGLGDGINRFAYTSGNPVGLRDPSGTKGASPGFEHLGFLVTTGRGSGGKGPKVMDTEGTDPGNVPEAKPPGKGGLSYGQYQAVRRRTQGVAVERAPGVVAAAPIARGALEATGGLAASTATGVGEFVGDKLRHPEKLFNPFDAIVDTVEGAVGLFEFASQSAEDLADAAADIDIAKATGDDAGLEHARERLGASAVNTTAGAGAIVLTGRGVLGLAKPRAKASPDAASAAKGGGELLHGVGPQPGVIEASSRVKSTAQLRNVNPRPNPSYGGERTVEFVYDPATKRFAVGKAQGAGSPHQKLANAINPDYDPRQVVGGTFSRGPNGEVVTTEYSGHFGENWTDAMRAEFAEFLENATGERVYHEAWPRR